MANKIKKKIKVSLKLFSVFLFSGCRLLLSASPSSFLKTLDSTLSLLFFLSRIFLLRSVAATIFCGTLEVSRIVVRIRIQLGDLSQYTSLSMTLASSFCYIAFAPSSLAISCFWKVLQVLGFDHLSSLFTVPLFSIFHSNKRPPFFSFV